MTRFVIDPPTAMELVEGEIITAPKNEVLAPTLLRSQVLDQLLQRVRNGMLEEDVALALNSRFAKRKFRYLGDAVLRRRAWSIAQEKGLATTYDAEYVALTQLQGDALVTSNPALAEVANGLVEVLPFSVLKR